MAEKVGKTSAVGTKSMPMKLFATWEVEKTSPNCIPRLCSLTLNRLIVLKPLESENHSLIIAVKMQNSKRTLRSNEICMPSSGLLDVELDLAFSLQYPHFLKREGNKLHVMLQRRKKYKNKTILGYKTLAVGQINMGQVLQRSIDKDLNLFSDAKENSTVLVAKLTMVTVSSQPVDHVESDQRKAVSSDVDRSPDIDNDSDDDYPDHEEWSNDGFSDCEHTLMEEDGRTRPRKVSRGNIRPVPRGRLQRNIKQRFIALLKKFKASEDGLDSEADHELCDPDTNPDPADADDIADLIDELEDLSDSGAEPELDTVSVVSTPKPRLRPFFTRNGFEASESSRESGKLSDDNSSRKNDSDSVADRDTDPDQVESHCKPKSPKLKPKMSRMRSRSYREKQAKKDEKHLVRRNSTGVVESSPRKALLDQLSAVLGGSDDLLPDNMVLVNTVEWQGQLMVQKLQEKQLKVICTCGDADVKAAISFLVTKIQKFCNSNSKSPQPVKVGIAGGDGYINSVLRPYVEQFSAKPHDWQNYVRFLVIPFGVSYIGKHLGALDNMYSSLFLDSLWKDTFEKPEISKLDSQEIFNRVSKYLSSANGLLQIPISEAMVMCRGRSSDDESSQMFVPFLSEVKIGNPEVVNASVDLDDSSCMVNSPSLSSSPPSAMILLDKPKETQTPPSSPSVNLTPTSQSQGSTSSPAGLGELMELQVDYWTATNKPDSSEKTDKASKKDSNKSSLKTTFRSLQVQRAAQPPTSPGDSQSACFTMVVVTREKKQKIMRLGKKAKDIESKSQVVEGINRLICTSKSQNYSLRVMVDGTEWRGIKFFQLSSQWQTHIKSFPVVVFCNTEIL
ncbi:phosphofurin acidic cluster sorting protein 2-like isoform X4 [Mizuhopecten yessoensis]|uniref:Phosphofurin acidic cluster sorting protein 2 n=1 Tax=Mizuhopecten yessoensis TaxID=6573 RepID=A0A210QCI5_MIZYE|nr:phosphofurin acidic cluster sorting protein 2-like isoform X3 [Mizuhopecten yessoensis]XP_021361738.1 phosphofurin acidic cluster sorting protein 2-like isoform X4 [Mizuhopecten yessoensis]OWF46415.1 Phosphofurin acidic cluster sorting protein 2 [Mizuhopecten yessoensis]